MGKSPENTLMNCHILTFSPVDNASSHITLSNIIGMVTGHEGDLAIVGLRSVTATHWGRTRPRVGPATVTAIGGV